MNSTDYATNLSEITGNLTIAQQLGLPVDKHGLQVAGVLGSGHLQPATRTTTSTRRPTYGLMASNPAMLQAAKDAGVKYLHGNMSFASQCRRASTAASRIRCSRA